MCGMHGLQHGDRARHVDVERRQPVGARRLEAVVHIGARQVDQEVHAAVPRGRLRHAGPHLGVVGDVGAHEAHAGAERIGQRLAVVGIDVGDDDLTPAACSAHHAGAYQCGATGDDGALAFESLEHDACSPRLIGQAGLACGANVRSKQAVRRVPQTQALSLARRFLSRVIRIVGGDGFASACPGPMETATTLHRCRCSATGFSRATTWTRPAKAWPACSVRTSWSCCGPAPNSTPAITARGCIGT